MEVEKPPIDILELPKKGAKDWQKVNISARDLCEDAVEKVKKRAMKRGIILKPAFRDYDEYVNIFCLFIYYQMLYAYTFKRNDCGKIQNVHD